MIYTLTLNPAIDKHIDFNGKKESKYVLGGKGINVVNAVNLLSSKKISTPIALLGGRTGEHFYKKYSDEYGEIIYVKGRYETRINLKVKVKGETFEFNEKGRASRSSLSDVKNIFEKHLKKGDILGLCGSLPQGLSSKTYLKLIKTASSLGVERIYIDVSGKALYDTILGECPIFLVKINHKEAGELLKREIYPKYKDLISAAIEIKKRFSSVEGICITFAGGAVAISKELKVYVVKNKIVENPTITIGAGDFFLGEFINSFENKKLDFKTSIISAAKAAKLYTTGEFLT